MTKIDTTFHYDFVNQNNVKVAKAENTFVNIQDNYKVQNCTFLYF